MISRRPDSKHTVSDRNCNICISSFLEKFLDFCESPILKNFAGINFHELTFSWVKKGIYFREFGRNSRNFLPAKICSLKLFNLISFIWHFRLHLCVETSINMFIIARIKVNDQFI